MWFVSTTVSSVTCSTGMEANGCSRSASKLGWSAARCTTTTNARPLSPGTYEKISLSAASPPAEAPIPTSMMWGNGSSFRGMAGAGNPSEWAQSQGKSLALLPACYAYPPYGDNSMSRQALLAVARHRHSGALQSRVGRSDPGRFCHLTSPHRGGSLHGHPPFARTPVQVMPSNIRVCGRWRSATRNLIRHELQLPPGSSPAPAPISAAASVGGKFGSFGAPRYRLSSRKEGLAEACA